ncbi:MAG: ornithine cyclodeaminase family protein [Acidobacteriota bacterium]
MRYIDEAAVASVLRMQDLIPLMRQTLIDFSGDRLEQPNRQVMAVPRCGGFFGSMPVATTDALGAKLVTFYPGNAGKNLHTHMAVIVLFRPETGEPMVMLDGRLITEMRTAAVTATFIDAVAPADVKSLAILGAGTQGKSHVEALSHVRQFEDIRIWNRTPERAERLAKAVGGRELPCEAAVRDAEVIILATSSTEPVLEGKWLRPGAKVATVGWGGPEGGEVDAATMSHVVVVDTRQGALAESGNIRRCNARIDAELGEVLEGRRAVHPEAIVVFDSIGMACEDIAAARLVYEKLAAGSGSS